MKFSSILALSAPFLALAAPAPKDTQLNKKAEAESFFIQTDVGWFDGGDKKRASTDKPAPAKRAEKIESTEKRAPDDAKAEYFFIQTDVGWFDGGDKKRSSIEKRAPVKRAAKVVSAEKREPDDAKAESFFLQTDVGWFDGGDKKRSKTDGASLT
jgi:N6-adenosine-specific RNA methylase IME4